MIYKMFLLIFFCLCASNNNNAAATDTLNQGDMLNSSASLVSNNGVVKLRFYNLNVTQDSIDWYLGVGFGAMSYKPFWLASRNKSITDNSGVLLIDETGKLMIKYTGGDPIVLYSGQSKSTVVAVLQDDGNFVLKEANSGGGGGAEEQILWQSFDSPTGCFLPGMKLGINHKTGHNVSLTSWLSNYLPAPGAFTLEWVPREAQLIVKRRGVIFWTSGTLDNNRFENVDHDPGGLTYIFSINSSKDEEYLMYTLAPNPFLPENIVSVTRLWLLADGTVVDSSINKVFFNPEICDGNSTNSGCERWKGPVCRSHGEKFQKRNVFTDDNTVRSSDFNASLSISDCKDICWNNCSCVAVQATSPNHNGTGCVFLYGTLTDVANGTIESVYIIIPGPSDDGVKEWVWILIAVAATLLIVILLSILFWFVIMRWRRLRLEEKFLLKLMSEAKELEIDGKKGMNLKVYSISSIMDATNRFSSENKLGEGGFGPVYKGLLLDGQEIAIKRLSGRSRQGLVEFKNELIIIAKLQHTNLVRLLGFCIQGEEKMLVYEYMPNKSLDAYIFDQSKMELLDWDKRFKIIEEIAHGLLYLHRYSRLRIIHRDLKASNILLDANMNPKISDFGMASIFTTQCEAKTDRIVGTYGYMSPEYAKEGNFSEKSDVFSFGVLVLEIVSGRKNSSFYYLDKPLNLIGYAWQLWKEGATLELMHHTLRNSGSKDQVLRCINVAMLCVEVNPLDRPTMSVVISMLTSEGVQLPMPKQPAFCNITDEVNTSESSMAENHSINYFTISLMDAR